MITVIDLKNMKETCAKSEVILCLGNFDGVHIGHRRLISSAISKRDKLKVSYPNIKTGVLLFREPPSHYLGDTHIPQLSATAEKLDIFASLGLDYAYLADFQELKNTEPETFVKEILQAKCHCVFAICGFNFRFGKLAQGSAETLFEFMDGRAEIIDRVTDGGHSVSSSLIRRYIQKGALEDAARLLARPFSLTGTVLHGKTVGRLLGTPTANQTFPHGGICPAFGVYATIATVDGMRYMAVSNVGVRPSFDDGDRINCETHLIGYDGDLYGRELKIEFYRHLRSEIRFSSPEELGKQIEKDIALTISYFQSNKEVMP